MRLDEAGARSPLNRTTIEGMQVPELLRRQDVARESERLQAGTMLGVADRQFVVPAQEATKRMESAQGQMTKRAGFVQDSEAAKLGENARQFDARLAETSRQFNEKNKNTPLRFETDPKSGARIAVLGNVMMRVEETANGFVKLLNPDGSARLVMNEDGDVVTFDPKTGEPVVDRRPVADKLGLMPGLSTASPTPVTRGPNQKKKPGATGAEWIQ
jgi:hypothetical protein